MADTVRDDRVLPVTRLLAVVIVPILTVAWVMLWVFPARSGELFSWPVKPSMTAMMLGATYLGGAWFFGRVALARAWHRVTLGFLPVATFAGILGVSTILHWDRYTPDHPSFILWTFLYLTLPFVIPVVWWHNARHDPGKAVTSRPRIRGPLRWVIGGLGLLLAGVSLALVVAPDILLPTWPWALTAHTARVFGAMFALSGVVGISLAIDRRPEAAAAIVQAQAIAVAGIMIGLARAPSEITWGSPGAWLFIIGMLAVLAFNLLATYGGQRTSAERSQGT